VINELGIPIVALGLKDTIVAAGPDGILVSDKGASSYLKPMRTA
jgi:mannose-1-phosphate guanylyltransferase